MIDREINDCVFNVEDLKPLVEHSRHSQEHGAPYGIGTPEPGLYFVHDQGVYLMSNGKPGLMRENGEMHQVVYAQDMSPSDEDWWETARAAVGGDDFAELIPLDNIVTAIERGARHFIIRVFPDTLSIMFA